MQNLTLGKILPLLAFILVSFVSLSATQRQIELSSFPNQATLSANSDFGFNVQFRIGELKIREVQTKSGLFDELYVEGWGQTTDVGEPQLPMLRQMFAVPLGARVSYTFNSQSARELNASASKLNNLIVPAQAPISKSSDPATMPFVLKEKDYQRKGYNERDWIKVDEIGYLRGVRVFALSFYPVRYDPVGNNLLVMQNLDVRIDFENPDLLATEELLAKTASWEFDRAYGQSLFNWQRMDRPSLVRYPTKMLILVPPNYVSTLQPFVDWKRQQGYNVVVTTVGSGGTVANATSAINTYMASVWSAATAEDPAPTYLLIVGDTSTSGDNIISNSGATGSHVTDLTYVRLQGTDYLPEMYYGR
ncbi:MAG: gingipain R, partial [Candidatus Syntrophosphaera sp.]|nr:gingipain R [Candidatus Syntrophosphaera sp.]